MTTQQAHIYHRNGYPEQRLTNVTFTDDGKVVFVNGIHDCELSVREFNEKYTKLI